MKRRPFLQLAVGSLAGTAAAAATGGYLGAFGGSTAGEGSGLGDSARSLSLSAVETFDYVVRLNDLGDDPTGRVTAFADLTDREREVFETAVAGDYSVRDPPEWLREFASGTPVVKRDGTYYRLESTLPTYAVTAEAVSESRVEGEIATYAEYERAVTRDEYVASGLLRLAREEGVELGYVWPSLRRFFESYDAARYHGEVLSFSVAVEDSGPPYELSATEVAVSEVADAPVWDASTAPKPTRELLRRAGRASGAYGFDRAPTGLLDGLSDHRYVHLDGTFYTSYVENRGPVPVSVSAAVRDGRLRLELRNESDRELRFSAGPPRPFGVVRCRRADGEDDRTAGSTAHLLWTDAYAESDRVYTRDRTVHRVAEVALVSTVAPGETVGETYAVPDLPPGEYVVTDSLSASGGGGENGGSTVQFRVTFAVE